VTRRPTLPLAARVARDVMGWSTCKEADCSGCGNPVYLDPDGWHVRAPSGGAWHPLDNSGDLMDVIGAMRERGKELSISLDSKDAAEPVVYVEFGHARKLDGFAEQSIVRGDWRGALAKAVCRAALEAVR
jgi:hypothetical protein